MEEKKKASMKLNKVRVLIFTLIILALIAILVISITNFIKEKNADPNTKYVEIQEDGTKVNTSKKLAENKKVNDIEIQEISLKEKDNITVLEARVVNKSNEKKEGFMVNIEFLNDKEEQITSIVGYIPTLEIGESTTIKTQTTLDFANSYNIRITEKK